MSKSLGNFKTVRDLRGQFNPETLRFAIMSAHYRSTLDFSKDLLDQAKSSLDSLYTALRDVESVKADDTVDVKNTKVYAALLDDLNTPIAISELHALAKQLNKSTDEEKPRLKAELVKSSELLGLLFQDPKTWFTASSDDSAISEADINALIAEREQAKKDKNYGRADEVREQLKAAGVVLEDSREGTTWRRE